MPPKNMMAGGIVALATHQSNGGAGVPPGLVKGGQPVALWSRHHVKSNRPAMRATVNKAVRIMPDVLSTAASADRDLADKVTTARSPYGCGSWSNPGTGVTILGIVWTSSAT
jgi:hypothetical protein